MHILEDFWHHPHAARVLHHVAFCMVAISLVACGPRQEESWNSYYYGTERDRYGGVVYPEDNDDHYVRPKGTWEDDQMPQGMKWK